MSEVTLTSNGRETVEALAARHGVSPEAVTALAVALAAGGGSQAQFNIPELGGLGQWSRGGMIMIGDMFNNGLKARVDALCSDISEAMRHGPLVGTAAGGAWWPAELGTPESSGAQNDIRYAYFASRDRLVVDRGGAVTVYDTRGHLIGGVGQQQSGVGTLSFNSDRGTVDLAALPVVGGNRPSAESGSLAPRSPAPPSVDEGRPRAAVAEADVLATLERLGALRDRGLVTDEEFSAKKAELLSRL